MIRLKNDLQDRRSPDRLASIARKAAADGRRAARKLARLLERLKDAQEEAERTRAVRWAIKARVARRAATLKRAIDDAGSVYLPDRLHAIRVALKKLRYGTELMAEVAGTKGTVDTRLLERAQGVLGRMHDLQTYIDRVRRAQTDGSSSDQKSSHELDTLKVMLEREIRQLHAGYMRDRAALLAACDRLGRTTTVTGSARRKVS